MNVSKENKMVELSVLVSALMQCDEHAMRHQMSLTVQLGISRNLAKARDKLAMTAEMSCVIFQEVDGIAACMTLEDAEVRWGSELALVLNGRGDGYCGYDAHKPQLMTLTERHAMEHNLNYGGDTEDECDLFTNKDDLIDEMYASLPDESGIEFSEDIPW